MTARIVLSVLIATLNAGVPASGQTTASGQTPIEKAIADQYVDPIHGVSLEQAIGQALQQ